MSLGRKIEVEPLSDARWSKIERSLFEKLERGEGASAPESHEDAKPRRPWRAAALAIAAIAAAVVVFFGVKTWWLAPGAGMAANPSRIVTGASDSHLALGETSIDVGPDSALLVSGDDDHGVLLVLDRGKVTCEVAPRRGRPPFVVQAGGVRVRVIGTRFTVTRNGDDARVDVAHGTVEVSARGAVTLVHDGETWPGESASAAAPTAAPQAAAPAPQPTVSADEPAPAPQLAAKPAASKPDALTPQQLFEQATKLESRDPSRAIGIYRQLASSGGAWAMNALFAWGRLEADRGNRGEARRILGDYLARYPKGPNAADARALLERMR